MEEKIKRQAQFARLAVAGMTQAKMNSQQPNEAETYLAIQRRATIILGFAARAEIEPQTCVLTFPNTVPKRLGIKISTCIERLESTYLMKSYWINKTPSGTELELRELPVPTPGPDQVLVRVRATSINRGDIMGAIKLHSAKGGRPAGVDGAGEVEAIGANVTGVAVGDRVMFRAKGCFAEHVVVESTLLTPIPACLNWEQAAVIPIAYITAYEALLQFGGLQHGDLVLIAGASSGVGVAAIQIAKMCGAKVIGTSGSAEKLARLKALGLDAGIQTRGENFAEDALKITGGAGVKLAVNLVGGSAFAGCLEALTDFGRLAVVGYVDGQMLTGLDIEPVHGKRLQIFGLSNAPLSTAMRAVAQRGFERDVMPAIIDGRIVPVIDRTFSFDELPAAKQYVEQNALLGKVAIRFA